ncbi:MAG: glycosyltransferase family 39 protein [Planctomycetes bacterium]|nr:glycosyltransferase family 39 protein [Planctomycetota bacterium]
MKYRVWLILVLLLCLGVRLHAVRSPLTGVHAWRQCDTAAVARNFAEENMGILYPRVDWRGDGPGYAEMEFPVFSYAAALAYKAIGVQEWVGRLLAALGGVITALYLARLIRGISGETTALWSALVFSILPLNVYYGQAFMPESWMLAASSAGVFHFWVWSRGGPTRNFLFSAVGVSLACLLKPTSLCLGLPLLYLAWTMPRPPGGSSATPQTRADTAAAVVKDARLWLFAALTLLPSVAWYWHAQKLAEQTGLSFGILQSDKFATAELLLSTDFWWTILAERLIWSHLTWAGAIIAAVGLLVPRRHRDERLFDLWLAGFSVSLFIVTRGHFVHEYYQLPIVLPLSFHCGRVLSIGLPRRWWLWGWLLTAVAGFSVTRLVEYQRIGRTKGGPMLEFAAELRAWGIAASPLIVLSGKLPGDPSLLYHAHAKGWAFPHNELDDQTLRSLNERGARYVCGMTATFASEADRAWLQGLMQRWPGSWMDERGFVVPIGTSSSSETPPP